MRQFIKSKSFRLSGVVALILAAYAMAGFWGAPKLLRNTLMMSISKALPGVVPTLGAVRVNPFLLQVEIRDLSLTGANGTELVGFGRLFVDFELSSLWRRAYTFSHIDIDSPFVNAVMFKDGVLNLAQLSPKAGEKPQPKTAQPIPALWIGSFKVDRGSLSFDDRRRQSDFATRLQPINFELLNFSTGVQGGRFTFTGASRLGERIEWHGHVSVQPIESDGEFQIAGLQMHTLWEYLEDQLGFLVDSGKIDLSATYRFSLKNDVDLDVESSKIALTDLAVRPRDAAEAWIELPELILSGTTLKFKTHQAHSDLLAIKGLKLETWLEPDGSLNLLKLATPPSTTAATPTGAAWKFDLREISLTDAAVSAEDRRTKPAAKLVAAPLSIKISGASLDPGLPLSVELGAKINGSGLVNIAGTITPQPAAADLNVKLAGIELAALQPYIAQSTSMTLLGGALSGQAKLHYGAQRPALQFSGNLSVANLHTVDNALHQDFINWSGLEIQGLNFQHDPDRLDIAQVSAHKLYARVIIEPDASVNVKRVLAAPGATVVAPSANTGPPVAASAASAPALPLQHKGQKAARAKSTPAMPILIKRISLEAAQANFADLSVQPNFATGIQNLQGTVVGLSSKEDARAKVDLHGSVDAFAPVSITGEVNVLGAALYTDLEMSFRNIELSTFNPYSGKFAGYNISKGKLTTELHYKVEGRKLDAQHHIMVDQLEFGDKTESKDAVSLPVKLAVALLKDRDGVIDFNLPVTGSLDDPQFKLGPIIWKVFINLLEKAVTAPFALLGSLFGGGPDLQFVDFQPGAADLDGPATEKARSMVKALSARPQLKIELPIAVINDLDRPRLAARKYEERLQAQAAAVRKRSAAAAAPFEQMDAAAQLDVLTQLYTQDVGAAPKFPEPVTVIKTKPDAMAAKIAYLNSELRRRTTVDESDLIALGQQRAMNLQQALLNGTQIDPERVFLVANDKARNQDGLVRLELSLR